MVLTDRQRSDLHAGIYEYLVSRGEAFAKVAEAMQEADPDACANKEVKGIPLLEKKWTAIPRLQKKVLELERAQAQNAKIHAHRTGTSADGSTNRRMLPRPPCSHTLQGHSGVVVTVQLHPVYTVVVSGSEDGTIKVWDHESGDYIKTLKGHTNTVNALDFNSTGSHLVSCSSDLSIKLWDFSEYKCIRTLRGHDHTISSVRYLGDAHVISASRDATLKIWDTETGFCDATLSEHSDWVRCLAVRPPQDGGVGGLFCSSGNDQVINVYETSTRKFATELRGHEHVVESLAFMKPSSDAKQKVAPEARDYLASGGRDRTVRLWNVATAECLAVYTPHENWVRSVLIHPSGNYVLSAGDDRTIRVHDIKANRCLRTLESAHNHFVTSISMHPMLPILVSGGVDQVIKCWMLD